MLNRRCAKEALELSMTPDLSEVGLRARRRIAWRLLPFAFLLYVVAYLDRVNVSFATLRMSADLGFSDTVYGLGVAVFYVGYILFEVPGAIIVERWSARRWIARIMISWGLVTVLTGFIHTVGQFYVARFLLGVAEASFFPGMIVYLARWFRASDRARAISVFYTAVPMSFIIGSPVAGWLLGIGWRGLSGWRWMFILEGIPAIVLGFVTLFYLTDRPSQARWLDSEERNWITRELDAEKQAKAETRNYSIWQAFRDRRILLLMVAYAIISTGNLSVFFWLPTFIKRLSGLPNASVALLAALPAVAGLVGLILNGWHSDKTGERRCHIAVPLVGAGITYLMLIPASADFRIAMTLFVVGGFFLQSYYPAFWALPTTILSESAAAAAYGLINSVGSLGGFFGPYIIGYLSNRTNSFVSGFAVIGTCYLVAAALIARLKIRSPHSYNLSVSEPELRSCVAVKLSP
jgi:ACS family tartrate transporter-like MFS transporter